MAMSRRLRFEVLQRDGHACRYCGAKAPDVRLTVDHVVPVALGGSDDPTNLVAACVDCNAGKSSITPGQQLIDDVRVDAHRWSEAMRLAANERRWDRAQRDSDRQAFADYWDGWVTTGRPGPGIGKPFLRPDNWVDDVDRWIAAGLTINDLTDMVATTMRSDFVRDRWRYFCGLVWAELNARQELAQGIAADIEHVSSDPKEA
jgi:hypothetical protein